MDTKNVKESGLTTKEKELFLESVEFLKEKEEELNSQGYSSSEIHDPIIDKVKELYYLSNLKQDLDFLKETVMGSIEDDSLESNEFTDFCRSMLTEYKEFKYSDDIFNNSSNHRYVDLANSSDEFMETEVKPQVIAVQKAELKFLDSFHRICEKERNLNKTVTEAGKTY